MSLRTLVNQKLSIERIVSLCGHSPDRMGFMLCPFHADSRPSFKLYGGDKGFFCFQCFKGGLAVEFFAYLKNISFNLSAEYLAKKFKIDYKSLIIETQTEKQKLRRVVESRFHFFVGWQRIVCKRFFSELETVPIQHRELVWDCWYHTAIPWLDRTKYRYLRSGWQSILDSFWPEYIRYLKFVIQLMKERKIA